MPYTKDDVSDHRMVNGEKVMLSDAERQAIADEWTANEAAAAAEPAPIILDDLIAELETSDPTLRAKLQARADARG
jgi:hypothetical protein